MSSEKSNKPWNNPKGMNDLQPSGKSKNKTAGIVLAVITLLALLASISDPRVLFIALITGALAFINLRKPGSKKKAETDSVSTFKSEVSSPSIDDMRRDFDEWDASVHLVEGQDGRFYRALHEGIITKGKKYPARILSPSGNTYTTSLKECTCPDFEKRHLPCKHMYRLALDRGIIDEDFIYTPFLPADVFDSSNPPANKYQNYATYKIRGINKETHRKKQSVVEARNESDLIRAADAAGLMEPIELIEKISEPGPTENQIQTANNYNLLYPDDISAQDMSYLLERAFDKRRADIPNADFARYADQIGVHFSRMIDPIILNNRVYEKLKENPREQLAMFAYTSYCKHNQIPVENFNDFSLKDKCYQFADKITDKNRSYILNLYTEQFYKPNASSTAYKTAISTLTE